MAELLRDSELKAAQDIALALQAGLNVRLLGQSELVKMVTVACLARGHVLLDSSESYL